LLEQVLVLQVILLMQTEHQVQLMLQTGLLVKAVPLKQVIGLVVVVSSFDTNISCSKKHKYP
jgi:hypothetical protein